MNSLSDFSMMSELCEQVRDRTNDTDYSELFVLEETVRFSKRWHKRLRSFIPRF